MKKISIPYIYRNLGKENRRCPIPSTCTFCPFNSLHGCKYKISILPVEKIRRVLVKHFPNLLLLDEENKSD